MSRKMARKTIQAFLAAAATALSLSPLFTGTVVTAQISSPSGQANSQCGVSPNGKVLDTSNIRQLESKLNTMVNQDRTEDKNDEERPSEEVDLFQPRSLLVGGQDSDPCEWAWHVALVQIERTVRTVTNVDGSSTTTKSLRWRYRCGGSLLSETHVLTAAHCVDDLTSADSLHVLVGLHSLLDLQRMSEHELEKHVVAVQVVHIHPGYYNNNQRRKNRNKNNVKAEGSSGNLLYDYAVLGLVAPPNGAGTSSNGPNQQDKSTSDNDFIDDIADFIFDGDPVLSDESFSNFALQSNTDAHSNTNLNANFVPELMRSKKCLVNGEPRINFVCLPNAPLDSEAIKRKYEGEKGVIGDLTVYADNVGSTGSFSGNGPNHLEDYICVTTGWGQSEQSSSATSDLIPNVLQETEIELNQHCSVYASATSSGGSSNSDSSSAIEQFFQNIRGDNYPSILCGSGLNLASNPQHTGSGSCAGDSGGPLVCKHKNSDQWVQYGIVSQGRSLSGEVLQDCDVSNEDHDLETWFADTFYARSWIYEKASLSTQPLEYEQPKRAVARIFVIACLILIGVAVIYEIYRCGKDGMTVYCYRRCCCGCCDCLWRMCGLKGKKPAPVTSPTATRNNNAARGLPSAIRRNSNSSYQELVEAQRRFDSGMMGQVPPAFLVGRNRGTAAHTAPNVIPVVQPGANGAAGGPPGGMYLMQAPIPVQINPNTGSLRYNQNANLNSRGPAPGPHNHNNNQQRLGRPHSAPMVTIMEQSQPIGNTNNAMNPQPQSAAVQQVQIDLQKDSELIIAEAIELARKQKQNLIVITGEDTRVEVAPADAEEVLPALRAA
ncbi:unnamed protein product [Amoebophrya sp. A120]|nr:unnamed protein product [Amoebophrya sp. A120]|eukprot:GSA120T00016001001.1